MSNAVSLNKSILTNAVALSILLSSFYSATYNEQLKAIGLFALSGALTNWLAIHMLFEKVPLLYGSGVIPNNFERFKQGIQQLIMQQFFTHENIERFLQKEEESSQQLLNIEPILDKIDFNALFEKLLEAINESSFGNMLNMLGGTDALEPLREPFGRKMRLALIEVTGSESFKTALHEGLNAQQISDDLIDNIESVVEKRLNEMTPELVKDIIQKMIKEHLGWLVVWGGVFGGLIGLGFSLI